MVLIKGFFFMFQKLKNNKDDFINVRVDKNAYGLLSNIDQ
jgi:hypothetical protein